MEEDHEGREGGKRGREDTGADGGGGAAVSKEPRLAGSGDKRGAEDRAQAPAAKRARADAGEETVSRLPEGEARRNRHEQADLDDGRREAGVEDGADAEEVEVRMRVKKRGDGSASGEIDLIVFMRRKQVAALSEEQKAKLRAVVREFNVQKKFEDFHRSHSSRGTAVLLLSQDEEMHRANMRAQVWDQIPSFSDPIPSAHEFIYGIPHSNSEPENENKKWDVARAIASTKIHYLTSLKRCWQMVSMVLSLRVCCQTCPQPLAGWSLSALMIGLPRRETWACKITPTT